MAYFLAIVAQAGGTVPNFIVFLVSKSVCPSGSASSSSSTEKRLTRRGTSLEVVMGSLECFCVRVVPIFSAGYLSFDGSNYLFEGAPGNSEDNCES